MIHLTDVIAIGYGWLNEVVEDKKANVIEDNGKVTISPLSLRSSNSNNLVVNYLSYNNLDNFNLPCNHNFFSMLLNRYKQVSVMMRLLFQL